MTKTRTMRLAKSLYEGAAVHSAIQEFRSLCDAVVTDEGSSYLLELTPRPDAVAQVTDEFLSYVLAGSMHLKLEGIDT